MANRKRVFAILRRAPDGSAFQKCDSCKVSIALALFDMHVCNPKTSVKNNHKRLKRGESGNPTSIVKQQQEGSFVDQPRSPFCFFMEYFKKTQSCEGLIDVDRKGFETWKCMSPKERHQFVLQAESVNSSYNKALLKEIDEKSEVSDEADSAMVGKLDLDYNDYDDSEDSDSFHILCTKRFESFDSYELYFMSYIRATKSKTIRAKPMDVCFCNNNVRSSSSSSTLLPLIPTSSSRLRLSHHLLTKPRLQRLKKPKFVKGLVISKASGFEENSSGNNPISKIFIQEAIGAEYGEGFETFRSDGPLKVDVDFLNDKLQEGFLKRIRYAMKPDEAFGLIFSWDNVVADTRALKLMAWKQLANEMGKEFPEDGYVQRSMLHAGAEHVLHKLLISYNYFFLSLPIETIQILLWEKEENELEILKSRLSQLYHENLLQLSTPMEGLKEWLDAVSRARIPCAIVSCLDRNNLVEALQRMGLKKYFQAIVTEEDGMESIAHRFLSAAVKLDRKPSKCVVFEDDPRGITAAHNCTMMAVGLIGGHRAYELVQSDLAVANFNELSVINLRRLFAHHGSTFMDLQKQVIDKSPPKRKLNIDTIF
ncbi:hypothetical protein GIB67_041190 [Kingdonia uniflora]|uniref:Uncharacterized protein n=1 Tax=Kingdonia uniflora TaxID=39325 RepID=A0A7J7LKP9_9MAGN|nr:hypothetical protein GIB67_041190 [Kingdonia uniflora]